MYIFSTIKLVHYILMIGFFITVTCRSVRLPIKMASR